MKKARQSSIELLRIIALSMVVFIHFFSDIEESLGNGLTYHTFQWINSLCVCAVDLFLIITGFFSYRSDKRSIGKALELIFQVSFYNLFFLGVFALLGFEPLSYRSIVAAAVPASYFVILYVALYLMSPYLNVLISGMSKSAKITLCTLLIIIFSIYPTVVDLFGEMVNVEWWGLSSIGAWGSQQGFNIVNFALCYTIGSLLRDGEKNIITWIQRQPKYLLICALFINTMIIFGWSILCDHLSLHGMRSSWVYHNPLVLTNAILLFLIFNEFNIQNSIINSIATASFTVFLIHTKILHKIDFVEFYVQGGVISLVLSFLVFLASVWMLSWVLAWCFNHSVGILFRKLKNKYVTYSL